MLNFKSRISRFRWLALVLFAATLPGCGQSIDTDEAVKFFGITYYNYYQIWRDPAGSWDDILTLAEGDLFEDDRLKLTTVRNAGYVVNWGTDPTIKTASEMVLAYHPDSLTSGGRVLFLDGSLRPQSADDLKTLLAATQ